MALIPLPPLHRLRQQSLRSYGLHVLKECWRNCTYVPWYICTMDKEARISQPIVSPHIEVERVQTGVRLEKQMLKVLKAIAEQKDMSLGDLLEGIVLHAFEGKAPFSPQTLKDIEQFRNLYGLTLRAQDSHQLRERR